MSVDSTRFNNLTATVISQLEGGYFHPNMLLDGRVKDQRYSTSGETMYGIDRKNGGAINDTTAGKQFWAAIDNANAANTWPWNYNGGTLAPTLQSLTGSMMYPQYQALAAKYLSPQAQALVESDDRLLFNFVYAVWNGAGWFQKFAKPINDAVAGGTTDLDTLVNIAVQSRVDNSNSLIAQSGSKIANFIQSLKTATADVATATATAATATAAFAKKNWLPIIIIGGSAITLLVLALTIHARMRNKV